MEENAASKRGEVEDSRSANRPGSQQPLMRTGQFDSISRLTAHSDVLRTGTVRGPGAGTRCASANESLAARERMLSLRGEPLFFSDWLRAVFIHYEVDPDELQRKVPFPLDLRAGRAYVSLVAFTMHGLRPRLGGKLASWLFAPIATHELLNVRTYVRHDNEPGIFFIAEWVPNRLSEWLGPRMFGLPYRHGRLEYDHDVKRGTIAGTVSAGTSRFSYEAEIDPAVKFRPCGDGSLSEFLLERYTAFTSYRSCRRFFRVWHPPWLQKEVDVRVCDDSLLRANFRWFQTARFVGANYAPAAERVWMGRPQRI